MSSDSGPSATLPDPPRRQDGRCARPGCRNRLPEITPRHRRYGGDAVLRDPFCSSRCARAFHGTQITEKKVA